MKIKRMIILQLIALLSLIALTSCGENESPDVPKGFVSAANDISNFCLYVPEDWVVDTAPNSLMASARENEYQNANVTMVSYTDEDNMYKDVPSYWESYIEKIVNSFDAATDENGNATDSSSFNMETEGKSCKIDGVDAMKYVYTATLGGKQLKYVQLIAKKKSEFYIFTYTTTPDGYDAETVDSIINNIKFK